MGSGAQYVMMALVRLRLMWLADSWDSLLLLDMAMLVLLGMYPGRTILQILPKTLERNEQEKTNFMQVTQNFE